EVKMQKLNGRRFLEAILTLVLIPLMAAMVFSGSRPVVAGLSAIPQEAQKEEIKTIQPEDLAKQLASSKKPVVLQTGIVHLYRLSNIRGSKLAGRGNTPEGLEKLKKEVEPISKSSEIVLYCGCCPWEHCPNINPAYAMLRQMGYTNVKALNLPHTFTEDWVSKGLPAEKGGE